MNIVDIKERNANEKGKKLRAHGEVPGIIFGKCLETNIPVKIDNSTLIKLLRSNSEGSIIRLNLNGTSKLCVVKKVDKDAVSGKVLHVEFQQVVEKEIIKLKLSVSLKGHENLALKRLVVENFLNEVELQGEVEKIPEFIELYVGDKEYNDKIYVKDIPLPEGVKFITEPETLLAIVN
ncbi:50S ribosomal protein L25 [Clostridium senegalense]|uniref:50S ribosomal protein L25 n=1 Tax=Clostridium senegalense TaxID=1465809 RepID=UPI000288787F|nr:50S ribosomal protein L25 [Clostridium senegalense]MBU5228306.1 50S ribosomal protein L25 [Clostridium senegalense]